MILIILFIGMWLSAAVNIFSGIGPCTKSLEISGQIIVVCAVIIGAPFMLIAQGVQTILDTFLPEGWSDDDETKFKY